MLDRVEAGGLLHSVFADEASRSGISARDRHLAQELCYGATRLRMRYDAMIAQLAISSPPEKTLRNIIRLGLHQLFAMRLSDYAAISETVELTRAAQLQQKAKFVNAVLREAQRLGQPNLLARAAESESRLGRLSIEYSHPLWVVSELQEQLARCGLESELEHLLAHNNSLPTVQLAIPSAVDQAAVAGAASTSETAVPGCFNLLSSLEPNLLGSGVWVQDLASQAVTRAFRAVIPEEANEVVDACAAPGGKSRLLRSLLPKQTRLRSIDKSNQRLKRLSELERGDNWSTELADFTEFRDNEFDAVLIDAPCSSLGSVRRKPDTKYRNSRADLSGYAEQQAALLESAWRNLKPGGVVGYVTCSPTVEETDRLVRRSMAMGWQAIDAAKELVRVSNLLAVSKRPNGAALLWGHKNQSDTMFLALLRKPPVAS